MAAAKVTLNAASRAPKENVLWMAPISYFVVGKYTPNTSYSTGGDVMDIAAALPYQVRGKPFQVWFFQNETTAGKQAAWDGTNKKVLLWNGTTQISSSSDNSANVFDMVVSVI